jgi:PUA-domain protein
MRRQLSKAEVRELIPKLGIPLEKQDHLEAEDGYLLINSKVTHFEHEGTWYPTISFEQRYKTLREVVVDMGAVKFISNGADVMRPGVTSADPLITQGEAIRVVDLKNKVVLAIGKSLFSGEALMLEKGGKVVLSLHHVGDKIWLYSQNH